MLQGHYELPLVLVSILVAVLASYTALTLAGRVSHADAAGARWWIAGGAFAMGTGIWSMHFVGMLAFRLPIPLGFDLGITLASWVLPVLASAAALWIFGRPRLGMPLLATAAVLIGLGINAMHYLGMAALRMQPAIAYDPWLVAGSIAIAVVAAGGALWMAFVLRDPIPHVWRWRAGAAVLMGAAIVGMHYTGMAAASFPLGSVCLAATGRFTTSELALMVVLATFAVLAIALLTAVYDARLAARSEVVAMAERTARERESLLERERAARAEAERLSDLKDQFLATLSHELRTPLNAILGWTQLLRLKKDPASLDRGLQTIERNARLQAQLIEDLLDMSRIVSGKLRLEFEVVEPEAIVAAAVETARPAAQAKGIALVVQLQDGAGPVRGDAGRLQQVLWNLLANAIKFTPEGGRIAVTLERQGTQAVVAVADNGAGIAPDFLEHAFDRFRQGDASTTRRHGGLGIGLSIVKQLVELHGGSVEAASAGPGQGATFTVRLPLATAQRPLPQASPETRAAPAAPDVDLTGLSILVVEDEADARELLQQLLARSGARVVPAADGPEALRLLRAERPQLLVGDIGMPGMDGYELIRRVRQLDDERLARIPALALTAFTRADDRIRALREGYDRYLPKPVEADVLLRELRQLAELRAQAA